MGRDLRIPGIVIEVEESTVRLQVQSAEVIGVRQFTVELPEKVVEIPPARQVFLQDHLPKTAGDPHVTRGNRVG